MLKNSLKCHPLLVPFVPVVELLGAMLGRDYEIVLHDVSGGEPVIVAIANGELTGRDMDAPMTDFGKILMTSPKAADIDFIANYPSEAENGRAMRSGVSLIRDENRRLIGFLCINYDMTRGSILKDMGDFLMETKPLSFDAVKAERFGGVKDGHLFMEKARQKFGKPLIYLSSEERKQCIRYMEEIGFFKLKGSVESLAKEMKKSRYTIYADLRSVIRDK
ncbi:MAG: helix-turn-helix transcriptional regulator [Synergistaceae bacterium]|nr:helix-turn-helix transcriptional regulator [Synergistaceae bacterium]